MALKAKDDNIPALFSDPNIQCNSVVLFWISSEHLTFRKRMERYISKINILLVRLLGLGALVQT